MCRKIDKNVVNYVLNETEHGGRKNNTNMQLHYRNVVFFIYSRFIREGTSNYVHTRSSISYVARA
jgi:hypothetical protein